MKVWTGLTRFPTYKTVIQSAIITLENYVYLWEMHSDKGVVIIELGDHTPLSPAFFDWGLHKISPEVQEGES